MMDLKKIKKQLEKESKAIKKELKRFAKKDKKLKGDYDTVFPDFGSAKDDNALEVTLYGDTLPVEYNLETRLLSIEKALQRIKNKTYGICINCKKPIQEKRLEVIPETELCLNCKQKNVS
ncbi:MAG: TraR/DksA C4-type zinc finger protein [bacterium]